ncbi:MAG: hypothetical protein JXO22_07870 [Phycisphaerae bacterium]|nr:hypothetical protein [Phycisphaerae bacterium]
MSSQPSVIVNKKGGFLTALVQGIFGFLIVTVICASIIGIYGLWVVDKKTTDAIGFVHSVTDESFDLVAKLSENLRHWREIAPPMLADALSDERRVEYAEDLDVDISVVPTEDSKHTGHILVEVTNHGAQAVTWLTARVEISPDGRVPEQEYITAIATPITFQCDEDKLRGPLLPGSTRRYVLTGGDCWHRPVEIPREARVSHEITELRVWVPTDKLAIGTVPTPEELPDLSDDASAVPN